jgi:equilibrative nucleoside transporter 1/2/3
MILLVTSLCLSTFIRGTPSTFFAFALFNAASMAVAVSYMCTAVYAGAALLGTSFLQIVLSGQAAIGVAVSAVQVVSSMVALRGPPSKFVSIEIMRADGREDHVEEIAARIFFGVSAIFLGIVLIAYTWLTRQSFYKSITSALEQHRRVGDDERTRLVAENRRNPSTEPNSHVYQVFRQNLIFMFSITYVLAITLVGAHLITVIPLQLIGSLTRRSCLRSLSVCNP